MARIFYSMSGDGRGHATRVRCVTEHLRREHELSLFAPRDAYRFLAPVYAGSEVRVRRIPGLFFEYDRHARVDVLRTAMRSARYLARLRELVDRLRTILEREQPDLVVTDFDPALPRAARAAGVPFVSLTHQHLLVASDLSELPPALRLHAGVMGTVVSAYYSGQAETIVSSFYAPPLREEWRHARQIGVLLRPELRCAMPRNEGHLVAYFRRSAPRGALRALSGCGRAVRVYGLPERGTQGGLSFRPISDQGFLEDLATCDAVVCTAGNRLVGEAFHLRKPVLAILEDRSREQEIDAHYVRRSGAAVGCSF